jgi:hypothetical protein
LGKMRERDEIQRPELLRLTIPPPDQPMLTCVNFPRPVTRKVDISKRIIAPIGEKKKGT